MKYNLGNAPSWVKTCNWYREITKELSEIANKKFDYYYYRGVVERDFANEVLGVE